MRHFYLFILTIILCGCADSAGLDIETFGSIKGIVMDKITEKPLSGVAVSISPLGKSMTTDKNGEFEFVDLDPKKYTVSVSKNQYNSDVKSITVEPGVTAQADFSIMTGNGAIELSKHTLDFGEENNSLVFDITNIGKSELFYNIASSYDWLKIEPDAGSINSTRIQSITASIDRTKIDEDKNVTLGISSNAGSDEIEIKVDFDENAPVMEISKSELDFGETETELFFEIVNSGKSTLTYEIHEEKSWLTTSTNSLNIEAGKSMVVTAMIDRDIVTHDEQTSILITSNGGSVEIDVKVKYLKKEAVLTLSETTLDFGAEESTLYLQVKNEGNDDLEFEVSENKEWLTISTETYTLAPEEYTILTATADREKLTKDENFDVVITSNGGNKSIYTTIKYIKQYATADMTLKSLDFGEKENTIFFQIKNNGNIDLEYEFFEDKDWFAIEADSYIVSSGGSVRITATVDRDVLKSDDKFNLVIKSNAGDVNLPVAATYVVQQAILDVTYDTLDFGESKSTLYLKIKNTGNIDLMYEIIENKSWIDITANSYIIAAGATEVVTAKIDRSKITSDQNVDVTISSNGGDVILPITIINHAAMALSVKSLNFGTENNILYFDVSNSGNAALTYNIYETFEWLDMSYVSNTVEPDESTRVTATVDRSLLTGDADTNITISSNGGDISLPVLVNNHAELTLSTTSLNFGETSTMQSIKVQNSGSADLTFNIIENYDWLELHFDKTTVAPGGYATVTATIDRSLLDRDKSISLTCASNGGEKTINLSVISHAELSLSTTSFDFGETSTLQSIKVQNSGSVDLTFNIIENYDWLELNFDKTTVAPGGYATVTAYIDRSIIDSDQSISLNLTSNAGNKDIKLSVISHAEMVLSSSEIDFGDSKSEIIFQITNTGNVNLSYELAESATWLSLFVDTYTIAPNATVNVTATADRESFPPMFLDEAIISISSNAGNKKLSAKIGTYTITSLDDEMPVVITGARMVGDDYEIQLNIINNVSRYYSCSYCLRFGTYGVYELATYAIDNLNNTYWLPENGYDDRQLTLRINNIYTDYSYEQTADFEKGATFPIVVTVKDVNVDATSLKKLQIGCFSGMSDRKCIVIENLPIIR